ncbi:MAG: hypothetical protein EPN57_20785 [Paraburkholderia sp.]|nr:MAG: hypothetical protein EPN57_20785 [Paraburkholderia sp.]
MRGAGRQAELQPAGEAKAAFGLRAAVGSAAAPGGAGEALVGQTSSSGVRLSDCQPFNLLQYRFASVRSRSALSAPAFRRSARPMRCGRLLAAPSPSGVNTYRRPAAARPARSRPPPARASAAPALYKG